MTGQIYKGIGGFYYVKTAQGIIECKPRGIFRKQGIKPVAGDNVRLAQEAGTYFINDILPRKNVFVRPPVANVDQFFLIASVVEPVPSFLVIDKLCAAAISQEAEPVLVITKSDIASGKKMSEVYEKAGLLVIDASVGNVQGIAKVKECLGGRLSVFCGNSGVGKSTLLNALLPSAARETGDISKKLGRGRHTTREVELFEVADGLVADTPGFASFDLQRTTPIAKEDLQYAFPEIAKLVQNCKYTGCAHVADASCAVLEAVRTGEISQSRHASYVTLYEEAKQNEKY